MLANFGLVLLLPLIWEKTRFSSPEMKWFIGEMFYPPVLVLLLESTVFCFLSRVSFTVSKSGWQWGEGIWHHSPACPVCTGCKGNSWPRGQVSLSAGNLWVLPSFLPPPPPQKSQLARWQQIATSCLLRQQEMALSRGDSSPELLRRPICRDIFPVSSNFFPECYRHSYWVLKMDVHKSEIWEVLSLVVFPWHLKIFS